MQIDISELKEKMKEIYKTNTAYQDMWEELWAEVINLESAKQSVPPAYGVFAAVFFFGFCCGAVAFNAICGGG